MRSANAQRYNVVIGMFRVARGRADGIECFGSSSQEFLASLAPLLAFPLVGTAVGFVSEGITSSLTEFAIYLCALLTPAVISFELARVWGRTSSWLRFATAFNWCEWILPLIACVFLVPLSVAMGSGLNPRAAGLILVVFLVVYGLWLHWFLARHALSLSKMRAALMVILVNSATVLVASVPRLIAAHGV